MYLKTDILYPGTVKGGRGVGSLDWGVGVGGGMVQGFLKATGGSTVKHCTYNIHVY